jgi:hypothetical protein
LLSEIAFATVFGYLKVAMFPGTVGVEVANEISSQVEQLGNVERPIIDLAVTQVVELKHCA